MLEKAIQAKIIKYLKTVEGGFFFKIPQGKYSLVGISDIIGIWHGRVVAIEVKAGNNTMTPLQAHFQNIIRERGGIAICAFSLEDVQSWIK